MTQETTQETTQVVVVYEEISEAIVLVIDGKACLYTEFSSPSEMMGAIAHYAIATSEKTAGDLPEFYAKDIEVELPPGKELEAIQWAIDADPTWLIKDAERRSLSDFGISILSVEAK